MIIQGLYMIDMRMGKEAAKLRLHEQIRPRQKKTNK